MKRYVKVISTPQAVWFKCLPNGWRATKIRELFSERNTKVSDKEFEPLSIGKMGVVPQLDTAVKTDNGDNRKLICIGDFAINSRSDRKGSCGISEYTGSCSLIITVLKPHNSLNDRFYHYLLRNHYFSEEFYRNGKGLVADLWTTKWEEMRNIFIPVPPRAEQDQIVRFLDWKTAKIDKLIEGYQNQIALLEEKKLSYIDRLITGKENINSTFVDSGVAWIGNIPSHWKVDKVKNHFQILKRIAGKEGYDVISITQQGLKIKDISSNEGQMASSYAKYQFIYPNEYAMNHMDLITGYIGLSKMFGVTSPDYRVFSLTDEDNCDLIYYLYVFQMGYKRKIFYGFGRGAANKGRWRMPAINFKNYEIPIPPIEEQKEIVLKIQRYEETINTTIKNIYKQIALLKEYRTRLISDVVTGQINVQDEVIPETR